MAAGGRPLALLALLALTAPALPARGADASKCYDALQCKGGCANSYQAARMSGCKPHSSCGYRLGICDAPLATGKASRDPRSPVPCCKRGIDEAPDTEIAAKWNCTNAEVTGIGAPRLRSLCPVGRLYPRGDSGDKLAPYGGQGCRTDPAKGQPLDGKETLDANRGTPDKDATCTCKVGFFASTARYGTTGTNGTRVLLELVCEACPRGTYRNGAWEVGWVQETAAACTPCPAGTVSSFAASMEAKKCLLCRNPPNWCKQLTPGDFARDTNRSTTVYRTVCMEGVDASKPKCAFCQPGWFQKRDPECLVPGGECCRPCPKGNRAFFIIMTIGGVSPLVAGFVWWLARSKESDIDQGKVTLGDAKGAAKDASNASSVSSTYSSQSVGYSTSFTTLLPHMQFAMMNLNFPGFQWPLALQKLGRIMNAIFYIDVTGLLALDCSIKNLAIYDTIGDTGIALIKFGVQQALFPMLLVLFGVGYIVCAMLGANKMKRHCINSTLAAHSLLIMVIAKAAFSLFKTTEERNAAGDCVLEHPSGSCVRRFDSVPTVTDESLLGFYLVKAVGGLAIVAFIIIVPLSNFKELKDAGHEVAMWEGNRHHGRVIIGQERWSPAFQQSHGWLFMNYDTWAWWYEGVIAGRKVLLAAIVIYAGTDAYWYTINSVIVVAISLIAQLIFKPFRQGAHMLHETESAARPKKDKIGDTIKWEVVHEGRDLWIRNIPFGTKDDVIADARVRTREHAEDAHMQGSADNADKLELAALLNLMLMFILGYFSFIYFDGKDPDGWEGVVVTNLVIMLIGFPFFVALYFVWTSQAAMAQNEMIEMGNPMSDAENPIDIKITNPLISAGLASAKPNAAQTKLAKEQDELRARLEQFLREHNPEEAEREGAVEEMAEYYLKKQDVLEQELEIAYGDGLHDSQQALAQHLEAYYMVVGMPDDVSDDHCANLAAKFVHKQEELDSKLKHKHGKGLIANTHSIFKTASMEELKESLDQFYKKVTPDAYASDEDPGCAQQIEQVAEHYFDTQEDLERAYVKKYGVGLYGEDAHGLEVMTQRESRHSHIKGKGKTWTEPDVPIRFGVGKLGVSDGLHDSQKTLRDHLKKFYAEHPDGKDHKNKSPREIAHMASKYVHEQVKLNELMQEKYGDSLLTIEGEALSSERQTHGFLEQ